MSLLIQSSLSALGNIIASLPQFVHPYVQRLLTLVFSSRLSQKAHTPAVALEQRSAQRVVELLARGVPSRLLLPKLAPLLDGATSTDCAVAVLRLLSAVLRAPGFPSVLTSGSSTAAQVEGLVKKGLGWRERVSRGSVASGSGQSEKVEAGACEVFVELAMRMSEAELAPVLARIAYWATDEEGASLLRRTSLYGLFEGIATKLRTVAVGVLAPFFADASEELGEWKSVSTGEERAVLETRRELVRRTVATLRIVMESDVQMVLEHSKLEVSLVSGARATHAAAFGAAGFSAAGVIPKKLESQARRARTKKHTVTRRRGRIAPRAICPEEFRPTLTQAPSPILPAARPGPRSAPPPRLRQVLHDNLIDAFLVVDAWGSPEAYKAFAEAHLVPCLAAYCHCAANDDVWRPLVRKLLMSTRHSGTKRDAPAVARWACLAAVKASFEKCGEEFVVRLPECLPFLAELIEDEDHSVEQLARATILLLEELSGESMQEYM